MKLVFECINILLNKDNFRNYGEFLDIRKILFIIYVIIINIFKFNL